MRNLILLLIPISLGVGGKEVHIKPIENLEPIELEVILVEPKFVKPTYTLDVEPLILRHSPSR